MSELSEVNPEHHATEPERVGTIWDHTPKAIVFQLVDPYDNDMVAKMKLPSAFKWGAFLTLIFLTILIIIDYFSLNQLMN